MKQRARCAFDNHWVTPSTVPNDPAIRNAVMAETSWGCLIYGYAANGKFPLYESEDVDKTISKVVAYDSGISLALGLYALQPEHTECKMLICPCKVS